MKFDQSYTNKSGHIVCRETPSAAKKMSFFLLLDIQKRCVSMASSIFLSKVILSLFFLAYRTEKSFGTRKQFIKLWILVREEVVLQITKIFANNFIFSAYQSICIISCVFTDNILDPLLTWRWCIPQMFLFLPLERLSFLFKLHEKM